MPAAPRPLASRRELAAFARRHGWLLLVLLLAIAVRVAAEIAYRPGLIWSDSWSYIVAGYNVRPFGILVDKPSGYPVLLRLLELPGRSLLVVTSVQHLAGLAGGILVYALLWGRGIPSILAAVASGVVLLDSYAIALEQHVLSEAFFTLALVIWMFAAVRWGRTPRGVVLAGLALSAAILIRTVALVAVPVWLVYCVWAHRDWRRRIAALLSVVVPLLCYSAYHESRTGSFGLVQTEAYLAYGRVGEIADCRGLDIRPDLRPLCPQRTAGPAFNGDDQFFHWREAYRLAGDPGSLSLSQLSDANGRLRDFTVEVIKARPLEYVRLVASDTLRFLRPGAMSWIADFDRPVLFSADRRPVPPHRTRDLKTYFPGYPARVYPPSEALRTYQRWVHTPRWLLAIFIVMASVEMAALVSAWGRRRLANRREVFLLVGAVLALLVGAALSRFEPRYLIPAVPLIVSGGTLAAWDLAAAVTGRGMTGKREKRPATSARFVRAGPRD